MSEPLRRERVVATARSLVEEVGAHAVSFREVARRLNVTAPALYDHVRSKDDLLRAVAGWGYQQLTERFEAARLTETTAAGRLRAQARAYVAFAADHPEVFRVMFQFRPAGIPIEVDNELDAASELFDLGLTEVRGAVADGTLAGDPDELVFVLWAAVHGVASVALLAPGLANMNVADRVIGALIAGLR